MMSTQGYRYALYHSLLGDVAFRLTAGARRFVWNQAVAYQLSVKDAGQPVPRYAAMCAKLLEWKTEYPWLKEVGENTENGKNSTPSLRHVTAKVS